MTKYLLLSGPPGAGKDTVGAMLAQYGEGRVSQAKFAAPLMVAAEAFGFDMQESQKEARTGPGGMSRREFQIALSETFAKPAMGDDVFGRALALRTRGQGLVVVTDSGFRGEAVALALEVGSYNVRRIHVTRPGKDYSRDSRTDWDINGTGIVRANVLNDQTEDVLVRRVMDVLRDVEWQSWLQ